VKRGPPKFLDFHSDHYGPRERDILLTSIQRYARSIHESPGEFNFILFIELSYSLQYSAPKSAKNANTSDDSSKKKKVERGKSKVDADADAAADTDTDTDADADAELTPIEDLLKKNGLTSIGLGQKGNVISVCRKVIGEAYKQRWGTWLHIVYQQALADSDSSRPGPWWRQYFLAESRG
jgi:hypothetical protein